MGGGGARGVGRRTVGGACGGGEDVATRRAGGFASFGCEVTGEGGGDASDGGGWASRNGFYRRSTRGDVVSVVLKLVFDAKCRALVGREDLFAVLGSFAAEEALVS